MRPDEHKRKKNAEYKKKHGISAKKGAGKAEKTAPNPSGDVENKKEEAKVVESKPKANEVDKTDEGRQFARRHVTSNWDKYEGLDVSEDEDERELVTRRGEDFTTLVERAGDPHSQFRFQAEKEWDDTERTQIQAAPEALEINFTSLTDALQALPLHRRLNIEQRDISPGLHNIATKTSEDNSPRKKQETATPIVKENKTTISVKNDNTLDTSITLDKELLASTKQDAKMIDRQLPVKQATPTVQLHSSLKEVTSSINPSPQSGQPKEPSPVDVPMDDELDFLLALDSKKPDSIDAILGNRNNTAPPVDEQISSEPIVVADEQGKKTATLVNDVSLTQNTGTSQVKEEASQDLEDWLDSVLS